MPDDGLTHFPSDVGTPLSFAVASRDRDALAMVERAVHRKNVALAYQPVVQSKDETPAFFEGLVRVLDDAGRTIPARDFIDRIETHEIGRIIDCLALELGLKALEDEPELRLSINMSARSIGYKRWTRTLEDGLAQVPNLRGRLILEITEASAMVVPDIVQSFMAELQAEGVLFGLDDFGAGYTSLRYLKSFCFDILKIDGQFVENIQEDVDNQVLMHALVDVARHFEMITVAERVETSREAAFLKAVGIECLQGYLYGAPTLTPKWENPRLKRP